MKKVKHGGVFTAIFSIISIGYICPILLVFINSFKKKAYISRKPFDIPTGKMYVLTPTPQTRATSLIVIHSMPSPPYSFLYFLNYIPKVKYNRTVRFLQEIFCL